MNCFIFSLVSAVVLLGSGSCFTIKQNSTDDKSTIIGGVILGQIVPHHVALKCNDEYFCGGSLITPQHVLTAAHCVTYMRDPKCFLTTMAHAGSTSVDGIYKVGIANDIIHPEYSDLYEHDVAVIKLASPFPISERIYPIPLTPYPPQDNDMITMTGFGRINRLNYDISSVIKGYGSWLVSYEECREIVGDRGVFPSDFCDVGHENEGVCSGDSGGPVVSGNYLVGVMSRVIPSTPNKKLVDCANGNPNVYASVYYHMDFINWSLSML